MDQGSVGVGNTCRGIRRREALHVTGRSGGKFVFM